MRTTDQAISTRDRALVDYRTRLFAVGLSVAALFHLAGNPRPPWIPVTGLFLVVQLAVAAAAVAVLTSRRPRAALGVLCALIPLSAWLEAPVVGNHWVLAAAISLCYVLAELAGWRRDPGSGDDDAGPWSRFAPAARLSVVIAYGFAAFAKFNTDFFDPGTSCTVFYHDQLVRSWGLAGLSSAGRPALGMVVAVAAAITELLVVVLLVGRRTRRYGLLLALPFHWVLALDWGQHFWDFSSVLFV